MVDKVDSNTKQIYTFPLLKKIKIKNFSLYQKADDINIDINNGVFCLAGANGLGKSTFLNILNYGMTGVVLNPDKDFSSIVSTSQFYTFNTKFSEKYFDGRVTEDDRERASVEIIFSVGKYQYTIERSFFDNDELIKFERLEDGKNTIESNIDGRVLFHSYCELLTKDIKLASFDQFVFLQHFLLTFDEHHHLLFWDKSLMETTLYLIFGLNVEDAQRANGLRKKINRYGSNIRNFTYQKNRTLKEVQELEKKILDIKEGKLENIALLEKFEQIGELIENLEQTSNDVKKNLRACDLNIADKSIKLSNLNSNYNGLFNQLMGSDVDFSKDEKVIGFIKRLQMDILNGKDGKDIFEDLVTYIKTSSQKRKEQHDQALTEQLRELDQKIAELNNEITVEQNRKDRLDNELKEITKELLAAQEQAQKFSQEESRIIAELKASSSTDLTGLIQSYYEQIKKNQDEIDERKRLKSEAELELKKLEKILSKNFALAEEEFIPIFQNFVENFLGLDVSVRLQNSTTGSNLVLEINDLERTSLHQLSESQRYFVDIGLRMALIQFACDSSFLLIDTPEGSLDIAYESKAGQMFAEFVESGHHLLITANINTSQLLIELAKKCKEENMKLERMTDWAYLSEVQIQEDEKIQQAYKSIEQSLK